MMKSYWSLGGNKQPNVYLFQLSCFKGKIQPIVEIQSLTTHPHADGKLGSKFCSQENIFGAS